MKKKIDIALAVILAEGRVLVGRRNLDRIYGGWWEFPGGKIEPGETPIMAVRREVAEELGDQLMLGAPVMPPILGEHALAQVHLFPYYACLTTHHLRQVAAYDLRFVTPQQLLTMQVLGPSLPIVQHLTTVDLLAVQNQIETSNKTK
ncbi:NUDIX domain-containing protein [Ligilactobacillus saerimneri]|uniref:(deoxy)nucleoside triphosphate pyrophosphohydrolase n=1 Tax=Ligilactobacillus saerimneri TaxID=228229 RepID=UPI0030CB65F4